MKDKILIVGGTFTDKPNEDGTYGAKSGFIHHFYNAMSATNKFDVKSVNGGSCTLLKKLLESTPNYDYVFWWANVDNDLEKIRNVKEVAPQTMLISSKRNDNDKYTFQELVQRSLALKANLTFEFKKTESGLFNIMIFDPLGSVWYDGTNINNAVATCVDRMTFLKSMTRQSTTHDEIPAPALIMKWYFDQFKLPEERLDKNIPIPDEQDFVDTVRKFAHTFQTYMPTINTTRFVGNASLRGFLPNIAKLPPQVGRCGKGMPSFRHDDFIFVSKRNVDKQFITLDNFVPVWLNENDKLMYSGPDKPSVDTPVQIRLYRELDHINYILHSHCYIKNAPFTKQAIPCGAVEEFDEIISLIHKQGLDNHRNMYVINLIGHGSIIMWNSMRQFHENIEPTLEYYCRKMPEYMK